MDTHPTTHAPSVRRATDPSPSPATQPDAPTPSRVGPLAGIERVMADALGASAASGPADAGSIEYASWLARLRRATP